MLSSIFYLLSVILLMIVFLIYPKSYKKQNILKWIIIFNILLFCYNSIIVFILSSINIPSYLYILLVCNLIVSLILFLLMKDKKSYQIYYFNIKDFIFLIILLVLTLFIFYIRFGFNFNISYETSDSGIHFLTAKEFFNHSYLLNKVVDKTVVDFSTRQFASYVNLGILFKVFNPFIGTFDLYKIYILFDMIMLFLGGAIFYFLFSENKKNNFFISLFGTIIYLIGYPLNSVLFGFFYLGHSITIISLIFLLYDSYFNKYIDGNFNMVLIFISMLTLFFTYYFFVPIIYAGLFIFQIYKIIKNKEKLISKNNLVFMFFLYILPCVIGSLYFIIPNIGNSNQNIFTQISLDGLCFIDIYNFFTIFLPIILLYFVKVIKNKNLTFDIFIYICSILFLILLIILFFNNLVSIYYLSKIYYLLWFIQFYMILKFYFEYYDLVKIELTIYFIFFLFCVIMSYSGVDVVLKNKTASYNSFNYHPVISIYNDNMKKIYNPTIIFTNNELVCLKSIYEKNIKNVDTNLVGFSKTWIFAFFQNNRIDYPENQIYDYISNNFYINTKSDFYFTDKSVNGLLFFRDNLLSYDYYGHDKIKESRIDEFNQRISLCSDCSIYKYDDFWYVTNIKEE